MIFDARAYLNALPAWNGSGELTLRGIANVLRALGDPQENIPAIHVAGTNGKGSVCASVASIMAAEGYRVGLTVSPHLYDLSERIIIDGLPITEDLLRESVKRVRDAGSRAVERLSFFETIIAVAFVAFSELDLDFIVLETGLGGRLDATNVISKPLICAITTISYDHQHILGESLGEIAAEKAGIIKKGVPVIIGMVPDEALRAIKEAAANVGAPIRNFGIEYWYKKLGQCSAIYASSDGVEMKYRTSLVGDHQLHNAALAIDVVRKVKISERAILDGLSSVKWPGRIEEVRVAQNRIIFDACHNEAGVLTLTQHLINCDIKTVRFVFGVIRTKNWKVMIDLLIPFARSWTLLDPDVDHCVDSNEVADYLSSLGVPSEIRSKDYEGVAREITERHVDGYVVVAGSMYMMGKLRALLGFSAERMWERKI